TITCNTKETSPFIKTAHYFFFQTNNTLHILRDCPQTWSASTTPCLRPCCSSTARAHIRSTREHHRPSLLLRLPQGEFLLLLLLLLHREVLRRRRRRRLVLQEARPLLLLLQAVFRRRHLLPRVVLHLLLLRLPALLRRPHRAVFLLHLPRRQMGLHLRLRARSQPLRPRWS
ncbi:uncharacterized protein B0I36DRAFT_417010, partial [Microdochium trichocladiopsis]